MLLANNAYPFDGRVSNEARSLVENGYRVTVVSKRDPGQTSRETLDGVHVRRFRLPGNPQGVLGYAFEFVYSAVACLGLSLAINVRQRFDAIHLHNPPDTLGVVGAFFRALGKRVVFDHHDLSAEMYDQRFDGTNVLVKRALRVFEGLCCRVADVVLVTNGSYRDYDIQRHGVEPSRIHVVRNGPLPVFLNPVEPDRRYADGVDAVIGYVGTIGYQDRVDYLLRSIRHLVDDLGRKKVRCLIVGDGDALDTMRAVAAELGIGDYVVFTDRLNGDRLVSTVAAADICVVPDPSNPYNDRSTMIKVMEYMALGKPIVAYDLPEHRVTAGEAALYVTPNDELEYARAIAELMDDPARREAMGELGRRRVDEQLRWDYSVPHLLGAYEQLLHRS
jgi:glycosyltransferase involved in cell wall biosynthesis